MGFMKAWGILVGFKAGHGGFWGGLGGYGFAGYSIGVE